MTNSYEEQVEKVARAICEARWFFTEPARVTEFDTKLARAAIAALSTDTAPAPAISGGEMVLAALKANACSCHVNCEPGDGFGCCHWQANEAIRALAAADRSAAAPAPDMVSVPRSILAGARETILSLVNARNSEAEGTDEEWVGDIDAALAAAAAAPQQGESNNQSPSMDRSTS